MAKYSFEFKLKLVQEHLKGEGGYKYICAKYAIPNKKPLRTELLYHVTTYTVIVALSF